MLPPPKGQTASAQAALRGNRREERTWGAGRHWALPPTASAALSHSTKGSIVHRAAFIWTELKRP